MSDLGEYNPNAKCPKCGHDQVTTSYCDGYSRRWYKSACDRMINRQEHLHRHCIRCNYEWCERCVGDVH